MIQKKNHKIGNMPEKGTSLTITEDIMIHIDLLKNHPHAIPALAAIWHKLLGKFWLPALPMERIIARFETHLNEKDLPLTLVALHGDIPVGMCSLRENDGIRPDLTPWLCALVVDPQYQKQGIGKMLTHAAISKTQELGFQKLYLFAHPITSEYYKRLGWKSIGMDEFNPQEYYKRLGLESTDEVESHPLTVMELDL